MTSQVNCITLFVGFVQNLYWTNKLRSNVGQFGLSAISYSVVLGDLGLCSDISNCIVLVKCFDKLCCF